MYAVGMLGGALLGALASQLGVPLGVHLFGLAALELIACGTAVGFYLTKEEVASITPVKDTDNGEGGGGLDRRQRRDSLASRGAKSRPSSSPSWS